MSLFLAYQHFSLSKLLIELVTYNVNKIMEKECYSPLSRLLWGGMKYELP